MKKLFFFFLFIPVLSFAQDCKLKKSEDPFTHETKLSSGFQNFSGNGLTVNISADAIPKEIDFFIWVKGDGRCFDTESTAEVVFDGEKAKRLFRNSGSMNCDGTFHFTFKNTPTTQSMLNRFVTKKVTSIKLLGTNGKEMIMKLTEEQKTMLQEMAKCIATEAKTLL